MIGQMSNEQKKPGIQVPDFLVIGVCQWGGFFILSYRAPLLGFGDLGSDLVAGDLSSKIIHSDKNACPSSFFS
jgi:hypothetical protein